MIVTTSATIEGKKITAYKGLVFGDVVAGVNVIKDFAAGISNIFGGRAATYEDELIKARENAIAEMVDEAVKRGADAVIGVKIDYETLGQGNMLMVIASGTAVNTI